MGRSPVLFSGDIGLNQPGPVGQETIPSQDHRAVDATAQMLEEREDRCRVYVGVGMKPKDQPDPISLRRDHQGGDG